MLFLSYLYQIQKVASQAPYKLLLKHGSNTKVDGIERISLSVLNKVWPPNQSNSYQRRRCHFVPPRPFPFKCQRRLCFIQHMCTP